jgi:hypothetical protein
MDVAEGPVMKRALSGILRGAIMTAIACTARSASAGTITSVQGDFSRGQSIAIVGVGFGDQGPSVALFDDFDDCAACRPGATVEPAGPDLGSWDSSQNFPTYTAEDSHAGLSMLASNYLPNSGGCPGPGGTGCDPTSNYSSIRFAFSPPATEVFWSFWRYLPAGQTFPLESCNDINWKISWLYGTAAEPDNVINDWIVPAYNEANHAAGFELPSGAGSNAGFADVNCGKEMYPMYMAEPAAPGNWIRYSVHVRGGSSCDGTFRIWQIPFLAEEIGGMDCTNPRNTCEMLRKERTEINTMTEAWHYLGFNAYARNAENGCAPTDVSIPRYDDVYVAVGPGAQARVELANHETWGDPAYAADLNMAICPPTAWSDASVTCTVRHGSFAEGQAAFLFVVDANGVISDQDPATPGAQGFPVVLGTSSPSAVASGAASAATGGASGPSSGTETTSAGSGAQGPTSPAGDADPEASDGASGCSCRVLSTGGADHGPLAAVAVAVVLATLRRRQRSPRRQ